MAKQLSVAGCGASGIKFMNDLPTVNLSAIVGRNVIPERNLLEDNYQVSRSLITRIRIFKFANYFFVRLQ
jgi:hypothetical protein